MTPMTPHLAWSWIVGLHHAWLSGELLIAGWDASVWHWLVGHPVWVVLVEEGAEVAVVVVLWLLWRRARKALEVAAWISEGHATRARAMETMRDTARKDREVVVAALTAAEGEVDRLGGELFKSNGWCFEASDECNRLRARLAKFDRVKGPGGKWVSAAPQEPAQAAPATHGRQDGVEVAKEVL